MSDISIVSDGQFLYWIAEYRTIYRGYELILGFYIILVDPSKRYYRVIYRSSRLIFRTILFTERMTSCTLHLVHNFGGHKDLILVSVEYLWRLVQVRHFEVRHEHIELWLDRSVLCIICKR